MNGSQGIPIGSQLTTNNLFPKNTIIDETQYTNQESK